MYIQTPQKEIKKLAEFLDVPADDDFVKEVAEKVVFDKLRHVKVDATVALAKDGKSILFRKGELRCNSMKIHHIQLIFIYTYKAPHKIFSDCLHKRH